jgi:thimet oligopeptidase
MHRKLALAATFFAVTTLATTSFAQPAPAPAPVKPADPLHAWVGLKTPADLANFLQWHIAEERRLIAQMLAVKGPRTEANTLEPFDRASWHLTLAGNETGIMFEVNPHAEIRDKAQALVQVLSKEGTDLALNQDVYNALKAVDTSKSDAATRHYLDRTLLEYRLAGVDKDQATRDKIRKLQDQATELSLKFSRTVQDDVRKVTVTDKAELDGLPADYIARHKPDATGAITLTTDSPDMSPVMSYAKSPKLRREMYLAYMNRAYPSNESVLRDLLTTRQGIANTLGYPTWADLATADQMIGSAANMKSFLDQVDVASRDRAAKESALLQNWVKAKDPGALPITQSDSGYWGEQYRRANYDFDSQSVRPYFAYGEVEAGILKTASRLFHIEFKAAPDAPVWDPSVHAYDVLDGGEKAGRIYLDMHPREGKDKWFSEAGLIPGIKGVQLPEATLVCNFSGGLAGDPGLMEFSEVVTFFHEFGHMMHEVLGGHQRWAGQSGITTEGDFVEAPSQMLEEMFHDPTILQSFARDYQTGKVMPLDVIDRMNRADYYGRANWVQRQLLFSTFALQVHELPPATIDFTELQEKDSARFNPYVYVPGNHFFAAFTHLTGYTSNYYTYVLDKVIAVDFFAAFDPKNLLDGPTALRYRRAVLEPGSSKPAADLVKDFLGRPQSIDALKAWMDKEFQPPAAPTVEHISGSGVQ